MFIYIYGTLYTNREESFGCFEAHDEGVRPTNNNKNDNATLSTPDKTE